MPRTVNFPQDNDPDLKSLDLFGQELSAKEVKELAQTLMQNRSLTSLNLGNNLIGNEGATAIAQALSRNTSLTSLNLWGNPIGNEGATAIAQALRQNTSLKSLGLGDNAIGNKGATAIAQVLERNTSLTLLELKDNNIGNEGVTAIAKALIQNGFLISLNLNSNAIGNEGATAIVQALRQNTTLMSLDLVFNGIDNECATAIADSLERNIKLKEKAKEKSFVLKLIDIARIGRKLPLDIFKMIGHTAANNMALQRKPEEIDRMLSQVYSNASNGFNNALTAEEKKWKNEWNGKPVFRFTRQSIFSLPPVPSRLPPPPVAPQEADSEESIDKSKPPSPGCVIQ